MCTYTIIATFDLIACDAHICTRINIYSQYVYIWLNYFLFKVYNNPDYK